MSTPIGSAFEPLWKFENKPSIVNQLILPQGTPSIERVTPSDPDTLLPVEPIEETITVYRIKNTVNNQYWSNGRWRAKGKVYVRKCDVINSLQYMSNLARTNAVIVEYNLVSKDSPLIERKELVNEIINFYTNTIKNFYEVLKKIS